MWAASSGPLLAAPLSPPPPPPVRRADTLLDRLIIVPPWRVWQFNPLHLHMIKVLLGRVGGRSEVGCPSVACLPTKSEGVLRRTSEMVNSEYDDATKQTEKQDS